MASLLCYKKFKADLFQHGFEINPYDPIPEEKDETSHTIVANCLFVCNQSRQNIQPAIAFPTTRVLEGPTKKNSKPLRLESYLKSTEDEVARISVGGNGDEVINGYMDTALAEHPDFQIQTSAVKTMGHEAFHAVSAKQKNITRSSAEDELASVDVMIAKVLWTRSFLQEKGIVVRQNIIFRDNQSLTKLEQNGKTNSGIRTRYFNSNNFYNTDLIQKEEESIEFCPTDDKIADYFTKPLKWNIFNKFIQAVVNERSHRVNGVTT
jgi:hypothetical protein